MRPKKTPLRMCAGCGEMKPKKELARVVRAPQKEDESGSPLPPERAACHGSNEAQRPAFCDILEKAGRQTQPAVLSLAFSAGKARLAGKETGPAYCFGSFMVKPIRFLTGSALRTQTLTMSPTLSTSLGCLIYLLQI